MSTASLAPRPAFRVRPLHLISLALIVGAIILGATSLQASFTPYVSISEAQATAKQVQVYGFLNDQGGYDEQNTFRFALQDEQGDVMEVRYPKGKPANFDQAIGIVAIGHYNAEKGVFEAEDLLVKCPSKYQEESGAPVE